MNNPPGARAGQQFYDPMTNTWTNVPPEPYTVASGLPTNAKDGDVLMFDGRDWIAVSPAEAFGPKSGKPSTSFFIDSDVTYVDTRRTFWAKILEDGVEE